LESVGLTQFPLDKLLKPRSVAVVGASPRGESSDGGPLGNLKAIGFDGPIYAVNPKYDEVLGYPCYPSIADLPEAVDAMFLAVGGRLVPDMLEQAGRRGIRAAVAFASGFAEGGAQGRALQRRIAAVCDEYGIAFCGPNNIGLLNLLDRTSLWVSSVAKFDCSGPVSIISHSGSVAMALSDEASRTGIAYLVTCGNEAVLTAADYLSYMADDPRVTVVAMFLEAVRDPVGFARAAEKARDAGIHVIAVKVGRSQGGRRAVAAHTAALAGDDAIYDAYFERLGVMRVADLDAMVAAWELLAHQPAPPPRPGVAVITLSGGEAALVADTAERLGLALPAYEAKTVKRLATVFPPGFKPSNPLDAYGLAFTEERFGHILDALKDDRRIGVIVVATDAPAGGGADDAYGGIMAALCAARAGKTDVRFVVLNNTSTGGRSATVAANLEPAGIPFLAGMAESLGALVHWTRSTGQRVRAPRRQPAGLRRLAAALPALPEAERFARLTDVGLPMVETVAVEGVREAVAVAREFGFPVVLKGASDLLPHKTEFNLLRLGVTTAAAVRTAYSELNAILARHAGDDGAVIVQRAAAPGIELILGVRNDSDLGPAVVVGLGGVHTEVFSDSSIRMAPVSRREARAMLHETRAGRLLRGTRGKGPYDIDAVVAAIVAMSRLAAAGAETLAAIEINPLIVHEIGAVAVDVLVEAKQKS
jgi:acetate---CoA ligase (ADP-forming)